MSVMDLPTSDIDDNDPNHNLHHEIVHQAVRGEPSWAQSGHVIDYDESLVDTSTSSAAGVAIPVSIVVPPIAVPFFVYFGGFGYSSLGLAAVVFDLIVDAATPSIDSCGDTAAANNALIYGFKGVYQQPGEVARTYTCKVRPSGGGTAHALGAANSGGHKFVWALYAVEA